MMNPKGSEIVLSKVCLPQSVLKDLKADIYCVIEGERNTFQLQIQNHITMNSRTSEGHHRLKS